LLSTAGPVLCFLVFQKIQYGIAFSLVAFYAHKV
jgi:hypothetical protein